MLPCRRSRMKCIHYGICRRLSDLDSGALSQRRDTVVPSSFHLSALFARRIRIAYSVDVNTQFEMTI